ncbi:MAG: flagellar hook-basal body complex protein, partial [Mariprofundus sp.]
AIQGRGFFQVQLANGETAYTRSGSFSLDANGQMVTQNGDQLQPGISIPSDALSVQIAADGTVSVTQPNATQSVLGQIQVADFLNPAGLTHMGSNLFQPNNASGEAVIGNPTENGLGSLGQGLLEMSNVNMVEEMVNLIAGQRAYEMNSKAIQASDEMLQTANNVKR